MAAILASTFVATTPAYAAPSVAEATAQPAALVSMAAGVAEAPVEVWSEGFEQGQSNTPTPLGTYATVGTTPRYSADAFWLNYADCNGVVVNYNATFPGSGYCSNGGTTGAAASKYKVRRMADVLGQVQAGATGGATDTTPVNASSDASKNNHAVTAMTTSANSTTGNRKMLESTAPLALSSTPTTSRYYTMSIEVAEDSCTAANNSRLNLTLFGSGIAGDRLLTVAPIRACDVVGGRYTSPVISGDNTSDPWGTGSPSTRAGTFATNASTLLSPAEAASVRVRLTNEISASTGNDVSFDNLRLFDATPSLDKWFSPATVVAGTPTTLTFTITNTTELASKYDWRFTDTLPSGVVVAPVPGVGGTCANATGTAAYQVTATAGASQIAVVGGDLPTKTASCTITVNVVAASAGDYTNGAANISNSTLVAPDNAVLTVTPASTITVRKNVVSRNLAADQFRLSVSSGGSELANATTTGSATGVQSVQVGPVNVAAGQTYTIAESVVSTQPLNSYTTSYSCVRDGVTIAIGSTVSGEITMPADAGANVVCTFTNTSQQARLYCDANYAYSVRANGSLAQINGSGSGSVSQLVGAVGTLSRVNALAVNADGTVAYAVQRSSTRADGVAKATALITYAVSGGVLQPTVTTFTGTQGDLRSSTGAATTGAIVGGAVDPSHPNGGRYIVAVSSATGLGLWRYDNTLTTGSKFVPLGTIAIVGNMAGNGDISFDAQGNIHAIMSNGINVTAYTVTKATLDAANGGAIARTAGTTRAMAGMDNGASLADVNGVAFTSRGTVYLGDQNNAYLFDPSTWTRVAGTARVTVAGTNPANTSSDLAGCASPSTLSLQKHVVGRVVSTDQFKIAASTVINGALSEVASATTTGSTTGVQAERVGPLPVQVNTAFTISETAPNNGALSTSYRTTYECWAGGVRIATGTATSGSVTIPNQLGVGVACTFFNSPAPYATVTLTKRVTDVLGANPQAREGWTMGTTASGATVLPSRSETQPTNAAGSATWQIVFPTPTSTASVTVYEARVTGWTLQTAECTVGGTPRSVNFSTLSDRVTGTLSGVAPGQAVACTFTNRPSAKLTLVKSVAYGAAAATVWNLSATAASGALAGPTGQTGSASASATVSPSSVYRLAETGGTAAYVQVGNWACVTATGTAVAVSSVGDVTLDQGTDVTCTVTNATSSLTVLTTVRTPAGTLTPPNWTVTATPANMNGLAPTSRVGADYTPGGNAANTFDVRPGHSYTLSQAQTSAGALSPYRLIRLERLTGVVGGVPQWETVGSTAITAPAAGQSATYRYVYGAVAPITLPLTGGLGADAFTYGGIAVILAALVLALLHHRRSRRSTA